MQESVKEKWCGDLESFIMNARLRKGFVVLGGVWLHVVKFNQPLGSFFCGTQMKIWRLGELRPILDLMELKTTCVYK